MLTVLVGVHLYSLLRVPAIWVDEFANASRAWGLISTGRAFGSLDAGIIDKYEGYWTVFPLLGTAIHAASLQLLVTSLFSLRITSLFFGLLLLIAVYFIGLYTGGRWLGLLAVALASSSTAFLNSSHIGRHDIIVAAFGYGAIALYLSNRTQGLSFKSLLSGLLIGLTLDIHYNGIIFIPVLVALYLLDHGWKTLRTGSFWCYVAGVSCGIILFVVLHILPYPQTYFEVLGLSAGSTHNPPLLSPDPSLWLRYVLHAFGSIDAIRLPVVLLACIAFSRWRTTGNLRLLVTLLVLTVTFAVVIRNQLPYYAILLTPIADLAMAAFVLQLSARALQSLSWRLLQTAVIWSIAAASFLVGLSPIFQYDFSTDYQTTVDNVRQIVPPSSSVMASGNFWFGLQTEKFIPWVQLVYYHRSTPVLRWGKPDALHRRFPNS